MKTTSEPQFGCSHGSVSYRGLPQQHYEKDSNVDRDYLKTRPRGVSNSLSSMLSPHTSNLLLSKIPGNH